MDFNGTCLFAIIFSFAIALLVLCSEAIIKWMLTYEVRKPNIALSNDLYEQLKKANLGWKSIAAFTWKPPRSNYWKGLIFSAYPYLCVILWAAIFNGEEFLGGVFIIGIPIFILTFPLFLKWRLFEMGRRLRIGGSSAIINANNKPVLYLRSFYDDPELNWSEANEETRKSESNPKTAKLERNLLSVFECFGPVLKVGQPVEELPQVGGSTIYLGEDWKERVAGLMDESQLVLIRMAMSQGIDWEIDTVFQKVDHEKIIISLHLWREAFSGKRSEFYERLKEYLSRKFQVELPPKIENGVFLTFPSQGKAEFINFTRFDWLLFKLFPRWVIFRRLSHSFRKAKLEQVGMKEAKMVFVNFLKAITPIAVTIYVSWSIWYGW
jgi:hypothetical protein